MRKAALTWLMNCACALATAATQSSWVAPAAFCSKSTRLCSAFS